MKSRDFYKILFLPLIFLFGGVFFFFSSCANAASSPVSLSCKMGIVDLEAIQAPYRQKFDGQLSEIGDALHTEFLKTEKDLREEKEFLDRERTQATQEAASQEKMADLQRRLEAFEKRVQDALKKEDDKRNELRQKLEKLEISFSKALQEAIQEVARENKIEVVLPKGVTLHCADNIDITEQVREKLSQKNQIIFARAKGFSNG